MSPTETSQEEGVLEHPHEALHYYRNRGVEQVICEEKHMGSRAIVIVCQHLDVACQRFGLAAKTLGVCYTRTGRSFFNKPEIEQAFLSRIAQAVTQAGLWDEHHTEWFCFDAELLPWSAKARALLEQQYAPVGAAAATVLPTVTALLAQAAGTVEGVEALYQTFRTRYRHFPVPQGLPALLLAHP